MANLKPAHPTLRTWLARAMEAARDNRTLARSAAGALGALTPLAVFANPTGGHVVAGSATITNPNANHTIIDQSSQRAIINWQQFSVGNNQYVQFIQPNSSSVVLNRVVGGDASAIFGNITANGQVFLVNTNGIYFARGATLDAQGFVGSTLDIRNGDFMLGRYNFVKGSGAPDASVVNDGAISADRKGYVVLAGDYVQNNGSINAMSGQVVLAAGNSAQLTLDRNSLISYVVNGATLARLAGVDNTGQIVADGGAVIMTADVANALTATAVNNSGFVAARSLQNDQGVIVLAAQGGGIENGGTLDAGALGGAGQVQGGTVVIRGTGLTKLDATSVIDTAGNGNAKGGFIELSGHTLGVRGAITAGKGGNLLLDPATINIVSGVGLNSVSVGIGSIGTGFIDARLNAGSNVAIVASNAIANAGGTGITATGTGNLTIAIGTVSVGPACGFGGICHAIGGSFSISRLTGTVDLTGLPIDIKGKLDVSATGGSGGSIIMAGAKAGSIKLESPKVTVNGNLTANTGSISVGGRGGASVAGLDVTGNIHAAGAFKVSFSNEGGATVGTVSTGNITAKSIFINAATISVGSLDATGSAATGDITLKAANGSVDVAGGISAGGALLISASAASNGGNVDISGAALAKNITINATGNGGGNVTTKGLHANGTAAGDGVSINAIDSASAFSSGQVNVTGSIISDNGSIGIHTQGGGDSGGAKINVTGGINAARGVSITANYIGSSTFGAPSVNVGGNITGKSIDVNVTGPNATVTLGGNLKATGANGGVSVSLNSGGKLSIGGNVTAGGNVNIGVNGGSNHHGSAVISGSVSGASVNVSAHGIGSSGGKITINGNVVATGTNSFDGVSISAGNGLGSGQITVNGNITSTYSVRINATGGTPTVTVNGNIHANTQGCAISDCNAGAVSIDAAGGKVDMNGDITVDKDNFRTARVSLFGANVSFGNITANGGDVNISADNFTSAGGLIKQAAGTTIKARDINVDLHASYGGNVRLANLVASSANAPAIIQVTAESPRGASAIVVNGNITVNGKANKHSFSSAMPGSFGTPFAAHLGLQANGGSSSGVNAHTVKVNGNINVTGHLGSVNFTHGSCSGECGPTNTFHVQGVGGVADVFLSGSGALGSVNVTGATTVKGPDAHVNVSAPVIKVGAITATGTGHNLTRSFTSAISSSRNATSNDNGGFALVNLGNNSNPALQVTAGNITVSGKGIAQVGIHAQHITAGNITVSATAAQSTRSNGGVSGANFPGLYGLPLGSGTMHAGLASVNLDDGGGSPKSRPNPSQTINTGAITVAGVGEARIQLDGSNMQTKSLSATAAAGTMSGSGTSGYGFITRTFKIKGGEAHIDLEGSDGSYGGVIKVMGDVSATGPNAGVDIFGVNINVSGGVQAKGGAASITSDVVSTGGSGYHTHFTGPGKITEVSIRGGSSSASVIKVGGTVSVSGKGLVGVSIQGSNVTLGGLSASASGAARYTILDTRVSPTAQTFVLGSVAAIVNEGHSGSITGPVTITGNVNLTAKAGSVILPVDWKVGGTLTVKAADGITADISGLAPRFDQIGAGFDAIGSSHSGGSPVVSTAVNISANSAAMVAGSSIDLTGATMIVTKELQLVANKDIILSGVDLNVGILSAVASGTIHNGGGPGTITAGGLLIEAGKDVSLSSTDITVKAGHVPGVNSDGVLNAGLGALGIAPTSAAPNATFIAGGGLTLGSLTMTGDYLSLQASSVTLLGPVTLPAHALVQVAPIVPTSTIGIEDTPSSGSDFNLSNSLFLSQFSGDTVVVGNFQESGDVTIGANGAFNLGGGTNLLIYSTGNVTGLDNVTSTGIVAQLITQAATPPPTAGEIDPNSGGTGTTVIIKKKNGETIDVNADTGNKGGTISQDTGTTSVCH